MVSVTGSMANTIGAANPFRYRGYYYDTETGFYYLNTRYYDPLVGRFLNADYLISTYSGIEGLNLFTYCLNNPINMCDNLCNSPQTLTSGLSDLAQRVLAAAASANATSPNAITLPDPTGVHPKSYRPNSGEPGQTYEAPNGDWRRMGPNSLPELDYDHDDHQD